MTDEEWEKIKSDEYHKFRVEILRWDKFNDDKNFGNVIINPDKLFTSENYLRLSNDEKLMYHTLLLSARNRGGIAETSVWGISRYMTLKGGRSGGGAIPKLKNLEQNQLIRCSSLSLTISDSVSLSISLSLSEEKTLKNGETNTEEGEWEKGENLNIKSINPRDYNPRIKREN